MYKIVVLIPALVTLSLSLASAQEARQERGKARATAAEVFERLDANQDGVLVEAEAEGPLQRHFDTVDTDNNGQITLAELENAPTRQGRGNGEQQREQNRPNAAEIMERFDTNSDGLIAESEAEGRLKENFDTVDTDQDGFISVAELENAPKPKRRRRSRS